MTGKVSAGELLSRHLSTHTNFLRLVDVTPKHDSRPVTHARSTKEGSRQGLAELHGLLSQILAHAVGDSIAVFAGFNAFLREKLNFGASGIVSAYCQDRQRLRL